MNNNDDIIWQIVGNRFCSFRVKTNSGKLCRNEYNLTGICNMQSCPLANSQYATVREREGELFLYVKTAERAHLPSQLWEKINLGKNYTKSLDLINNELQYWSPWIAHKCKQRLTKLTQYLIRKRKLMVKDQYMKLVPIKKKQERRLKSREIRAEQVARLDKSIEKELLTRLKMKAYGEDMPLNIKQEFESEGDDFGEREYISDFSESETEDFQDIEDFAGFSHDTTENKKETKLKKGKPGNKKRKGKRSDNLEIEYEHEKVSI
ncbi:hypothetical protein BB558_000126 [Smittium angustum]|uniref:Protein MAK16 n=1 Tax=Smittium angustum TaxID=133377 RepID=A0A2U1JF50_SMIAN|nr:hypothetical protein BB558_000126 [Smittium angustum]